jgi:hypothetical protein
MMLTVLLPECALGVQLPALGHFGNLLTLLLVANPVFGSAGTAVAVVLNRLVRQEDRVLLTRVQKWCALKAWVALITRRERRCD